MKHTRFSMKLEPMVGSNVEDVFSEAITLSRRFGVMIVFDFNDTHCYVYENDEVDDLMNRFYCAREKKLSCLPIRDTRMDNLTFEEDK